MSGLKATYREEIVPKLMEEFGYKNVMQVPKLSKIVLNMGLGEAIQNIKILDAAVAELSLIAGQKPVISRARKSIATFKLRAGMPIGCTVTLRGIACMTCLPGLLMWHCPEFEIFEEFLGRPLTVGETTPWGSKSISFFPKSTTTKSTR